MKTKEKICISEKVLATAELEENNEIKVYTLKQMKSKKLWYELRPGIHQGYRGNFAKDQIGANRKFHRKHFSADWTDF